MSEEINEELFEHLVHLAAIQFNPEEAEYLRSQLNKQLKAIKELEAIPVDQSTPIASHGVPFTPQISQARRKDEWLPEPDPTRIIQQAPETEDGYIVVPEIPHTDL